MHKHADILDNASEHAAEMVALAIQNHKGKADKLTEAMDSMGGVCLMCGHKSLEGSRFCSVEDRDEYDHSVKFLARTGLAAHNPATGLTMESYLDVARKKR